MRKHAFPINNRLEAINIKLKSTNAAKARYLSIIYNSPMSDILQTLIEEGIEDYELKYGTLTEATPKHVYNAKRDLYVAGDNKRHEFEERIYQSNGKLRTCYGKNCKLPDRKFRESNKSLEITIGREIYRFCSLECQKSMFGSI